jgi:tetratricopeptide (TPR) repeat protein
MIVRIEGEGQFLVDDSLVKELSERNAKLEAAIKLNDEAGFQLALGELLAWVRSVGMLKPKVPDVLEPSNVFLPSEEAALNDERPAFAAVALYRQLAAADPDRYRPDLAASLNDLAARLLDLGRPDDAAVWVKEAVTLYRELAAADPDRYRPDLAASLNTLGAGLLALDRLDDALLVTEEAAAVHRDLAAADPDRYRPDLAISLTNLFAGLFGLGRLDEARLVTEETVALYRELAAADPDRYRPDLADSLTRTGAGPAGSLAGSGVPRGRDRPRRRGRRGGPGQQPAVPDPVPVQAPPSQQSGPYDDLVRRAFAELVQPGRLLFNPPARMRLGDTERVEVRLTRTLTLDAELLKDLRGHGEPQLEEISTSPLMAVTLHGDGFRITPYGDEEQSVTPDGITTWEFDIRALKRGQQRLVMSVSLRIPVAGQPLERKSIPVREATIDVQVEAFALIGRFVAANWQWFVGTAIAIAAVLVAVLH